MVRQVQVLRRLRVEVPTYRCANVCREHQATHDAKRRGHIGSRAARHGTIARGSSHGHFEVDDLFADHQHARNSWHCSGSRDDNDSQIDRGCVHLSGYNVHLDYLDNSVDDDAVNHHLLVA